MQPTGQAGQPSKRWGRQHVQAAALVVILGGSFALHAALSSGHQALAAVCFAAIVLAMAITMAVS